MSEPLSATSQRGRDRGQLREPQLESPWPTTTPQSLTKSQNAFRCQAIGDSKKADIPPAMASDYQMKLNQLQGRDNGSLDTENGR